MAAFVALALPALAQRQFDDLPRRHFAIVDGWTEALALGDVDGDGDLDLWFGMQGQDRLYLNDGSGLYTEAPAGRVPVDSSQTFALALADVDGDADLDLVLGRHGQNGLWLNDGSGTFTDATPGRMPADSGVTYALACLDVEGDGDLDLLCGNVSQNALYLNDGAGNFASAPAGWLPIESDFTRAIAIVDVDADGDPDAVLGNSGQDRLHLNDGTGRFTDVTAARMPVDTSFTLAAASGDVDGDGDLDVALGDSAGLRLLVNDGSGVYHDIFPSRLPHRGARAEALDLGDVDGDGDLDLVVGNHDAPNTLYTNNGAGFTPSSGLPPDRDASVAVVLADVNGDGDLDLLSGNEPASRSRLYLNDGAGVYADTTAIRFGLPVEFDVSESVATGDIDGDGDLDIFFGRGGFSVTGETNRLCLNDGHGRYVDASDRLPTDTESTMDAAFGDFDGDGDLDLVIANGGFRADPNRLYLNDGSGTFTDATATRLPADTDDSRSVAVGDVDRDGDLDLVFANLRPTNGQQNRLYLNDGTAVFSDATSTHMPIAQDESSDLVLADLDGDGDLDLVFANAGWNERNRLLLNDGTGAFRDATLGNLPADAELSMDVEFGDVDGDRDLDLVFANQFRGTTGGRDRLYLNDGAARFGEGRLPTDGLPSEAVAMGDVDEDGDLDLVLAKRTHSARLLLNGGAGTFFDVSATRIPPMLFGAVDLALGDVDGDRDPDLVVATNGGPNRLLVNLARQLHAPLLLRPGYDYLLEAYARHGRPTAADLVMPFLSAARATIPLPPLGTLGIDPTASIVLPPFLIPATTGVGAIRIIVPAQPALLGAAVWSQAVMLPFPYRARLTNVVPDVVLQ